MGGQDNSRCRTKSGLDNADDVGNAQTAKQRPKEKVLKSGGTRRKIVNQRVIFHIDSNEVVETGSWEVEDTRNLLGMEKIRCLVPVLHISQDFILAIQSTSP